MTQKFSSHNKLCECRDCGKTTHSSIEGNLDIRLCKKCYEKALLENEHSDGHHHEHNSKCFNCRLDTEIEKACERAQRESDRVSIYSDGENIVVRLSVAAAPPLPEGFLWVGEATPNGKFSKLRFK